MPRERDKNAQKFHKGHYEIIAARFREEMSKYVDDDGYPVDSGSAYKAAALVELAATLADRFEFDSEEFDRAIFMERCGVLNYDGLQL